MKSSFDISNFLEEISSLSHSVVFLFLSIDHWGRLSYLSFLFFGILHSNGYIFPFLLCFTLLFTAICKTSSDSHFAFLHFFFFCIEQWGYPLSKGTNIPWTLKLLVGSFLDQSLPLALTSMLTLLLPHQVPEKGCECGRECGTRKALCEQQRKGQQVRTELEGVCAHLVELWAEHGAPSFAAWKNGLIYSMCSFSCPHRNGQGNKLEIGEGIHKYLRMRTSNEW